MSLSAAKPTFLIVSILLFAEYLIATPGSNDADLCLTKPFNYTVRLPGCYSKVIQNNFCYGLCRSFFYSRRRRYGAKITSVCSFCAPVSIKMKVVRLKCHGADGAESSGGSKAQYKYKAVKIFTSCKCKRSLCEAWPMFY